MGWGFSFRTFSLFPFVFSYLRFFQVHFLLIYIVPPFGVGVFIRGFAFFVLIKYSFFIFFFLLILLLALITLINFLSFFDSLNNSFYISFFYSQGQTQPIKCHFLLFFLYIFFYVKGRKGKIALPSKNAETYNAFKTFWDGVSKPNINFHESIHTEFLLRAAMYSGFTNAGNWYTFLNLPKVSFFTLFRYYALLFFCFFFDVFFFKIVLKYRCSCNFFYPFGL